MFVFLIWWSLSRVNGCPFILLQHQENFTLWTLYWNMKLISMLWIRYIDDDMFHWIVNCWRFSCLFIHDWAGFIIFQNDWTVLHKAIIGKNQAITNYLLRESANPFVRDKVSKVYAGLSIEPVWYYTSPCSNTSFMLDAGWGHLDALCCPNSFKSSN